LPLKRMRAKSGTAGFSENRPGAPMPIRVEGVALVVSEVAHCLLALEGPAPERVWQELI